MENGVQKNSEGKYDVFLLGEQVGRCASRTDAENYFFSHAGSQLKAAKREAALYRDFIRGIALNINNMLK